MGKFDMAQFAATLSDRIKEESRNPNIKAYTPHEKQARFHGSNKKRKLYIGGNRSGKTTGGVTEGIWRATGTHPYRPELNNLGPTRGRVVAVDFINGVDKFIYPQYKQWLYPSALRGGTWETAYDRFTRTLNFSNGSTIEFMSYDQDLDKFAGTSRHWIHFDEEPPRPVWVECLARLVDTDGEFWITMTPVEGMTWIYDDLYENNVDNLDGDVEVIKINTLENPFLSGEAIQNFVKAIDDDDVTTRIGGQFVQQGGRVYKNFDPTPGHAQVLSEPIDEPKVMFPSKNWLWILGLDHGLNNPTAVLWMAVNEAGFCVIFDEWYKSEYTVDQHAKIIKERIRSHGRAPDLLVADPSIQNRNGITNTSIQEEYQRLGLSFILGNNDVKSGIVRVKKYLNKHPYVGNPLRRSPLYGGPPVGVDPSTYISPETDGLYHKLMITPNCGNLIHELKRYRWKTFTDKKKQFENNPYEEPHKKDDHAADALRYMIMTRPDLIANSGGASSDNLDEIMRGLDQKIAVSGDWGVADPNNLLNSDSNWEPGNPLPSPSSDGWEYDEHMGGAY